MASRVNFDFAKAKTLIDTVNNEKNKFNTALEEYKREITGMHEWWEEEGALDAFVERCDRIAPKMDACIAMIDEARSYVSKVSNAKDDMEKIGKNRFK